MNTIQLILEAFSFGVIAGALVYKFLFSSERKLRRSNHRLQNKLNEVIMSHKYSVEKYNYREHEDIDQELLTTWEHQLEIAIRNEDYRKAAKIKAKIEKSKTEKTEE